MKRYAAALALAFLAPGHSIAQGAQAYVLTSALIEEIFQKLSRQPYSDVAPLITKLQAEIQRQPPPPPPASPNDHKAK